jgi:zinc transport system substrate-binding protein
MRWFLLAIGLVSLGCNSDTASENPWTSTGKGSLKVLVSFPPLHSVAASIAGPDAEVKSLLTGAGPHASPDPNRQQLLTARYADLFFYNGLGLDDEVVAKIKKPVGNRFWQIIDLGKTLDEKKLLEGLCFHEHGHEGHDHDHGFDPHVWLNPQFLSKYVDEIVKKLSEKDAAHAGDYASRGKAFQGKMEQLITEGKAQLKDKKEREFVSFHDSLRYFAKAFDLTVAGAIQVDPGAEPGPAKMKEIVDLCVKRQIRIIAVEPQFPRNTSAQAIKNALSAKGIEVEFVEIDPLETAAETDLAPDWYFNKMKQNLDNLAKVLR